MAAGSRVLDLGAGRGSFATTRTDIVIVRLDLSIPKDPGSGCYVAADAQNMPFPSACFDLIISNHSLEHFPALHATLREIGRVLRPHGALYVAVPDAGTLSDYIYRWMARGGGHVNPFYRPEQVVALVERLVGVRHRSTRLLYGSLSIVNRNNQPGRPQWKSAIFAFGNEPFLAVFMWCLRWIDLHFGTPLSHYGWAFYFGEVGKVDPAPEGWPNVCVRCGSGNAVIYLWKVGAIPPIRGIFTWYRCPSCGARNLLTDDT